MNGYENLLQPPTMKTDVTFWLNYLAAERADPAAGYDSFAAINTAIEATSLNDRSWCPCCCCQGTSLTEGRLLPQDLLIRSGLFAQGSNLINFQTKLFPARRNHTLRSINKDRQFCVW